MSLERPIRQMEFRVFQHATEDRDKVLAALRSVAGPCEVSDTRAEGYHGNPIIVIETAITSRADIDALWERVRSFGLCRGVGENLEERINDGGELFLRFDKQQAVAGRLELSFGDDVIRARGRVLVTVKGQDVRADRNAAVDVMRQFLTELEKGAGSRVQGAGTSSGCSVQGSGND